MTSPRASRAANDNLADSEAPTIPAPPIVRAHCETMRFGHYVINQHRDGSPWILGRGGMGVTFKATDTSLQCPVALKIISPQCFGGEYSERRFLREARLAAQIRHPNVAAIHHLDQEDGQYFYAMEFVDGITAEKWVQQQGRMLPELALDIVMQITRALTAADRLKVVHRDIKPGNIMILPDPANRSRVIAKLIDFGLARSFAGEASPTATTCGFTGTPQFASPEQAENLELDVRSDIYSLGSTLWYLLVGEAPFVGTAARVIARLLTSEPPWERVKPLPKDIVRLLRGMLAKDPADRIQTPVELHDQICRCRENLAARLRRTDSAIRHEERPAMGYALPSAAFAGVMGLVLVWIALSPKAHEVPHLPPTTMSPPGETGVVSSAHRPIAASPPVKAPVATAGSAQPSASPAPAASPNPVSTLGRDHSLDLADFDRGAESPLFAPLWSDAHTAANLKSKDPVFLTLGGLAPGDAATKEASALASRGVGASSRSPDQRVSESRRRSSRQQRHASPWQALNNVRGTLQGFVRSLF